MRITLYYTDMNYSKIHFKCVSYSIKNRKLPSLKKSTDYENLTLLITFVSSYLLFSNDNNCLNGDNSFFKFVLILLNKVSVCICVTVSAVRLGVGLIEKFASIYIFSTKKKMVLQNSLGVWYLEVKKTERDESTPFRSTQHV